MPNKCPYPTECQTLAKYIPYPKTHNSRVREICNVYAHFDCLEYKFLEKQKTKSNQTNIETKLSSPE